MGLNFDYFALHHFLSVKQRRMQSKVDDRERVLGFLLQVRTINLRRHIFLVKLDFIQVASSARAGCMRITHKPLYLLRKNSARPDKPELKTGACV